MQLCARANIIERNEFQDLFVVAQQLGSNSDSDVMQINNQLQVTNFWALCWDPHEQEFNTIITTNFNSIVHMPRKCVWRYRFNSSFTSWTPIWYDTRTDGGNELDHVQLTFCYVGVIAWVQCFSSVLGVFETWGSPGPLKINGWFGSRKWKIKLLVGRRVFTLFTWYHSITQLFEITAARNNRET